MTNLEGLQPDYTWSVKTEPVELAAYKEKVRELQAKVDSQGDTIRSLRGWKTRYIEVRKGHLARIAELERQQNMLDNWVQRQQEEDLAKILADRTAPKLVTYGPEPHPDSSSSPRPWWKVWG